MFSSRHRPTKGWCLRRSAEAQPRRSVQLEVDTILVCATVTESPGASCRSTSLFRSNADSRSTIKNWHSLIPHGPVMSYFGRWQSQRHLAIALAYYGCCFDCIFPFLYLACFHKFNKRIAYHFNVVHTSSFIALHQ